MVNAFEMVVGNIFHVRECDGYSSANIVSIAVLALSQALRLHSPDSLEAASFLLPTREVVHTFHPGPIHLCECTKCSLAVDREEEEHLLAFICVVFLKHAVDLLAHLVLNNPHTALERNMQVVQVLRLDADHTSLSYAISEESVYQEGGIRTPSGIW